MSQNQEVYLGQVVQHVACMAYEKLIGLTGEFRNYTLKQKRNKGPNADPNLDSDIKEQKKTELKEYLGQMRHIFLRLLVLVKWTLAGNNINILMGAMGKHRDYHAIQERCFRLSQKLRMNSTIFHIARAPIFDIETAVEMLSSGSYLRLPKQIALMKYQEAKHLDDKSSGPKMNNIEALEKLEQLILARLLKTNIPNQFTDFKVENGTLVIGVLDEFKVSLTLSGSKEDSPWAALRLSIFVQGEPTSVSEACDEYTALMYRSSDDDYSDDEMEEEGGDMDERERNAKTNSRKRKRIAQKKSKKKDNKSKSSNTLMRPKPRHGQYLLQVLQQKLLTSKVPFIDVYEVMHGFCVQLCIEILAAQAEELSSTAGWKNLFTPKRLYDIQGKRKRNILEIKHWRDSCSVRVLVDFTSVEDSGRLLIELDPPLESKTLHYAKYIPRSTSGTHRQQRTLKLGNRVSSSTSYGSSNEGYKDEGVQGLNPSKLNVEKLLLFCLHAQAEARLQSLGLHIYSVLSEINKFRKDVLGLNVSVVIHSNNNTNNVVLQIQLPMKRYLNVMVGLNDGDFTLALDRPRDEAEGSKEETDDKDGVDKEQIERFEGIQSRKWGTVQDVFLLDLAEKQINSNQSNKSTWDNYFQHTASIIVHLAFRLSNQIILELIEETANEKCILHTRNYPFLSIKTEDGTTRKHLPKEFNDSLSLYLLLGTYDEFDPYYLRIVSHDSESKDSSTTTLFKCIHFRGFNDEEIQSSEKPIQVSRRPGASFIHVDDLLFTGRKMMLKMRAESVLHRINKHSALETVLAKRSNLGCIQGIDTNNMKVPVVVVSFKKVNQIPGESTCVLEVLLKSLYDLPSKSAAATGNKCVVIQPLDSGGYCVTIEDVSANGDSADSNAKGNNNKNRNGHVSSLLPGSQLESKVFYPESITDAEINSKRDILLALRYSSKQPLFNNGSTPSLPSEKPIKDEKGSRKRSETLFGVPVARLGLEILERDLYGAACMGLLKKELLSAKTQTFISKLPITIESATHSLIRIKYRDPSSDNESQDVYAKILFNSGKGGFEVDLSLDLESWARSLARVLDNYFGLMSRLDSSREQVTQNILNLLSYGFPVAKILTSILTPKPDLLIDSGFGGDENDEDSNKNDNRGKGKQGFGGKGVNLNEGMKGQVKQVSLSVLSASRLRLSVGNMQSIDLLFPNVERSGNSIGVVGNGTKWSVAMKHLEQFKKSPLSEAKEVPIGALDGLLQKLIQALF